MLKEVTVWEAFDRIVEEHPDRIYVITPREERTYRQVHERALAFAGYLTACGLGAYTPRRELGNWESGQDHLAIYLGNGVPYLEAMLGALRARVVPANVNYRYVADELAQLLDSAGATSIVYDEAFGPTLAAALADRQRPKVLVQVGGDHPVIAGAVMFDDAIAIGRGVAVEAVPEPDDLCIVCTGGTTGLPKAVIWRQSDLMAGMIGDRHLVSSGPVESVEDLVIGAGAGEYRVLMGPPLMHLTGFGMALILAMSGGTMVLADPPTGMDAASLWRIAEQAKVDMLVVVGDAFGRPLLAELQKRRYDTSALRVIVNGAASMAPDLKQALAAAVGGGVRVTDGIGSSESGVLARSVRAGETRPGVFRPTPHAGIVAPDLDRFVAADDPTVGWLAGSGRLPLGYLNDPAKTSATFPIVDGRRCTIPGDRARWLDDGSIEILGRDATTINTGGEKVFSDEVERILVMHPAISEALVVGRPSERWGQEVVALVVLQAGVQLDPGSVLTDSARHLARYKLPKEFIVVERIERTAVGKADYAWAKTIAAQATTSSTSMTGS